MWKVTELKLFLLLMMMAAAAESSARDKRIIFQGMVLKDHTLRSFSK